MQKKHKRLVMLLAVLAGLGTAAFLLLTALKSNVTFFYTPTQVMDFRQKNLPEVAAGRFFRLGGMVEKGSLKTIGDGKEASFEFKLTDGDKNVIVRYTGVFPDLFREGQGAVARGTLGVDGIFAAEEILAKHDENYHPPGMKMPENGKKDK